ncbi:MAG: hypothetical protein AB1942_19055 [Pseudomonadota bacterium]
MLTVIIDARTRAEALPALLAQLTAGAVEGLVRQVCIVANEGQAGIDLLCEDMGADAFASLTDAAAGARGELVVVAPADLRLRDGWVGALERHLGGGGKAALVEGLGEGGLFGRRPFGVLLERDRLQAGVGADLQGLRRQLGLRPRRVG